MSLTCSLNFNLLQNVTPKSLADTTRSISVKHDGKWKLVCARTWAFQFSSVQFFLFFFAVIRTLVVCFNFLLLLVSWRKLLITKLKEMRWL